LRLSGGEKISQKPKRKREKPKAQKGGKPKKESHLRRGKRDKLDEGWKEIINANTKNKKKKKKKNPGGGRPRNDFNVKTGGVWAPIDTMKREGSRGGHPGGRKSGRVIRRA